MATPGFHETNHCSDTLSRTPIRAPRRASPAVRVPIAEIDLGDLRFQHRLAFTCGDLVASLRSHGQLTPVILSGARPPYVVVDGFRRLTALQQLGRREALATILEAASEETLFVRSLTENLRRRSLGPYDKANAIWQALRRFPTEKRDLAALLGFSLRQLDRYLRLVGFAPPLRDALEAGRLSMAHAIALHRAQLPEAALEKWIEEIASTQLSAAALTARLRSPLGGRPRGPRLVRDAKGFRLAPIRFRRDLCEHEKRAIWDALEQALALIARAEERR